MRIDVADVNKQRYFFLLGRKKKKQLIESWDRVALSLFVAQPLYSGYWCTQDDFEGFKVY